MFPPLRVGETNPKTGTLQNQGHRQAGLTLIIPSGAGVTSIPNNRIVSIQENAAGIRYAVPGLVATEDPNDIYTTLVIVGVGVLEEALQSGGLASIAPNPNTFVNGDVVTVLVGFADVYAIDFDESNEPTVGIASCRVDAQGRLTSVAADSTHKQLNGSVFISTIGLQMTNQLKDDQKYYMLKDAVTA